MMFDVGRSWFFLFSGCGQCVTFGWLEHAVYIAELTELTFWEFRRTKITSFDGLAHGAWSKLRDSQSFTIQFLGNVDPRLINHDKTMMDNDKL